MKILITGSLGHIGSRVIPNFPDRFELKLTDIREGFIGDRPVEPLDITKLEDVLSASQGVDAILHLAIATAGSIITDPVLFDKGQGKEYFDFNQVSIDTNIRGTYNLMEAARQNGVSRFIYGSSLTVLLGQPVYDRINDNLRPRPSNFYGVTKLWGEELGEFFSRAHGLTVYCLRFGTPHPWRENQYFDSWLNLPTGRRTFVSYEDLAGSMLAALEAKGPAFGAYSIVSACAGNIFDVSKGTEIGWTPTTFVEEDGSVRPNL